MPRKAKNRGDYIDNPLRRERTPSRYVAYSDYIGVYLGFADEHSDGKWSLVADKCNAVGMPAPTFTEDQFESALPADVARRHEVRFVQVVPTGPDNTATVEDCAKVLLPRW